jgi:hypothetical protein
MRRPRMVPQRNREANPAEALNGCAESGAPLIVEPPGDSFVAIQSLEPTDGDSLADDLLGSNAAFRALVARSKASTRKPFAGG